MKGPKQKLRRVDIEPHISDRDVEVLTRFLAISEPAARLLLSNADRVAVRAKVEQLGSHPSGHSGRTYLAASCTRKPSQPFASSNKRRTFDMTPTQADWRRIVSGRSGDFEQ
jgi:hypothetical protein